MSHGAQGYQFLTLSSAGDGVHKRSGNNYFVCELGRQISLDDETGDWEMALVQARYGSDAPLTNDDVFVYSSLCKPTVVVNQEDTNLVRVLLNQNGTTHAFEESSAVVQWRPLASSNFSSVEIEISLGDGSVVQSTTTEALIVFALRHVRRS